MRHRMPRFQAENIARNRGLVERFGALARDEGASPAQLALAWLLGRRPFVVPIPGTCRVHWLEENLAAADLAPSRATLAALDELFAPGAVSGERYSAAEKLRVDL